jgi:hypothetical protein
MSVSAIMDLPQHAVLVGVQTTANRASTPEEIAARCADKIVYVPAHADQEAQDRALEVKNRITALVAHYISEAIKSDRAVICSNLDAEGHPDIAELIRSF